MTQRPEPTRKEKFAVLLVLFAISSGIVLWLQSGRDDTSCDDNRENAKRCAISGK